MKRWNKTTDKWEPYQPAGRSYPVLSLELKRQLDLIETSSDGMMRYWPARVVMRDGRTHDRIYFADSAEFIKIWGVWPGDDSARKEIPISEVVSISNSQSRLPRQFADKLYRAGESGMGYVIFEILYSDGMKSAHLSGNAVDFIDFPNGKTSTDISDVIPHAGQDSNDRIDSPGYEWCLFCGESDKPSFFKSLFKA